MEWFRNTVGSAKSFSVYHIFQPIARVRWHQSFRLLMRSSNWFNYFLADFKFFPITISISIYQEFDFWIFLNHFSSNENRLIRIAEKSDANDFSNAAESPGCNWLWCLFELAPIVLRSEWNTETMQQLPEVCLCYFTLYLLCCTSFPLHIL